MPAVEETLLTDDFLRQLMSVGEVDLLIAIPSHNDAKTIGDAVATIAHSYQQNFPRERVVIVNVDGGSRDGTSEVFLNTVAPRNPNLRGLSSLRTIHRVATRYAETPSPGLALRTILATADLLRAKACALMSPAMSDSAEELIVKLLHPVCRENFDFVAPLYRRQKYDGLLARNLLYPMTRAVFGRRIRELHSDEFGFSGGLASFCLNQDAWQEDAVRASPEPWMTITAICAGFQCCQSFLGSKVRTAVRSGSDIVAAIRQSVATLFGCLEKQESYWIERTGSEPVPTFGPDHELTSEPLRVNRKRILEMFRSGVSELEPILKSILSAGTHAEIQRIAALDDRKFSYAGELWVRTLYEFAASYHHAVLNRDHLIQAFVPLYRGRIYSFLMQHQDSSPDEMEADGERLCQEFERQKSYLIEKWKAKE